MLSIGSMIYANGDKYVGLWQNDKRLIGIYTYPDGSRYIFLLFFFFFFFCFFGTSPNIYFVSFFFDSYDGAFKNNLRHGKGTFINNTDGSKYSGQWREDIQDGIGERIFSSGGKYNGGFIEGYYHGRGELVNHEDGCILRGNFIRGYLQGKGELIENNGLISHCEFVDGKRQGNTTLHHLYNALSSFGNLISYASVSLWIGVGSILFPNGDKWEGKFNNNEPQFHGQDSIYTFPNGDIFHGNIFSVL
jgi:hypothetical protein